MTCVTYVTIIIVVNDKMIILMFSYNQEDDDIDDLLKDLQPSPKIIVLEGDGSYQFLIVAEKEDITESCDFQTAIVDIIAVYFTFNMAYPNQLYPVLLFLQHNILDIIDEQKVPNVVKITCSAMDKF